MEQTSVEKKNKKIKLEILNRYYLAKHNKFNLTNLTNYF